MKGFLISTLCKAFMLMSLVFSPASFLVSLGANNTNHQGENLMTDGQQHDIITSRLIPHATSSPCSMDEGLESFSIGTSIKQSEVPPSKIYSAQISGDSLQISNEYCQVQFSGQFISSLMMDGNGTSTFGKEWLSMPSGYVWYVRDAYGAWLQTPTAPGTWENITSTIPGGNTTDGVYRLNENLGGKIQSNLDVWLNGSELTLNYSFDTIQDITAMKNGWSWVFNEPIDGYGPELIDIIWSYDNGMGRHTMPTHQMKRRPFHYIWSSGQEKFFYQGLENAGASVNFSVPPSDEIHLFLNESNYLSIVTYPFGRHQGGGDWFVPASTHLDRIYTMDILPVKDFYENGPEDFPRFEINSSIGIGDENMDYGKALTHLFWERVYTYPCQVTGTWVDWCSTEYAWNSPRYLDEIINGIETIGISPEGHVVTWGPLDGWPFPDNDSEMFNENFYDTRHPTTNQYLITAIWRIWQWVTDDSWLDSQKSRIYTVANFFLDMLLDASDVDNASHVASVPGAVPLPADAEGLLFCDWVGHHGGSGGIGNNYWDIQPFGWLDSYANALAYGALLSMADFEEHWNNFSGRDFYLQKAEKLKQAFHDVFWDDIFGRYIGCIDAWGEVHDYGYTFINQQAAYYGLEWGNPLVNDTYVYRMYDWMEKEPTGTGLNDTFTQWVHSARSNTDINHRNYLSRVVEKDWWVAQGQYPDEIYDEMSPWPWCGTTNGQLQNGGSSFYTSYHDLMARSYYFDSDNTEKRIREILNRWILPDHLCGGIPHYTGDIPQLESSGSVGTDYPFPESGMVPQFLVYGLMGMTPRWREADGPTPEGHVLILNPKLPNAWDSYSANHLLFAGTTMSVSVNASHVKINLELPYNSSLQLEIGGNRYNITDIADVNGTILIEWNARQEELQQKYDRAASQHASQLASGQTLNNLGLEALSPVPDINASAGLPELEEWWFETSRLMMLQEYDAILAEINEIYPQLNTNLVLSAAGREMVQYVSRQVQEAQDSDSRGDLRWMLGNYRQALVIANRIKAIEGDSMPSSILQWFVIPFLFAVAAFVAIKQVKKKREALKAEQLDGGFKNE